MAGRAMLVVAALTGVGSARAQDDDATDRADNLLTLARGGILVSASAEPRSARSLTDGAAGTNWSAPTRLHPAPYVFVLELAAPAVLTHVGIDGAGARPGGVAGGSAGPVLVEGSATGPDAGYAEIARLRAAPEGRTLVAVAPGGPVRWLRFTVGGGQQADVSYVYLDGVVAQGAMGAADAPDRFTGAFQDGRADLIELRQDNGSVTGCFSENGGRSFGTLSGAVQDGVAFLTYVTDLGISGPATLTRDSTGALVGVRYRDRSRQPWGGPMAPAGTTTPCSATRPPANPVADALAQAGEVRIYGIHFDHDSDVPKTSSAPALNQLRDALTGAPGLAVTIEGHTDASGAEDYNLDLSERRAAAVVGWLTAQGIDAARLAPAGRGETEPVAPNDTADGRALNRRVEVVVR
jgi:outer membrane protein OmpA-like peptidoglycan-associated protein